MDINDPKAAKWIGMGIGGGALFGFLLGNVAVFTLFGLAIAAALVSAETEKEEP